MGHLIPYFIGIPSVVAIAVLLVSLYSSNSIKVSLGEFTQLVHDAAAGRISHLVVPSKNDEIGQLGSALNDLLLSVRAREPFRRIPNPYIVGNPIRSKDMFFGRQDDLGWINNRLGDESNKFISLIGQRRIGKTSLLHQIHSGSNPLLFVTFFIDTQQILPEIANDSDFYRVLLRDIVRQLGSKTKLKPSGFSNEKPTSNSVLRLLRLVAKEQSARVVLLFDEIDNLDEKFQRSQLSGPDTVLFISGLLEGEVPISFVSTASERADFKSDVWSILTPKMVSRRIGLLSNNDAIRLIEDPLRGELLYAPGIVGSILRLTAGHPYYTQVVCQNLVDHLNERETSIVGPEQLDSTINFIIANPPLPLAHLWNTLSLHSRAVFGVLAECIRNDVEAVGLSAIMETTKRILPELADERNIRDSLATLRNEDWLEEVTAGLFRFRLDLLRHWVSRHHQIFSLAADYARGVEL